MFVPKKDGSCRLVVNYCRLNNWTKKNVYLLPCPDDLMAQLRGAKVFTKLDLQWGYNNVQVKEGDKWKTAFCTRYGLYESLVMTFGLTNAPATFQHFMNKLFKDLLDVCVIIYLDDILIYSKDDATHTQHIHEVLQCLMENQLFCKASKCTFHVTSVEYLGIIVLDKGFSLDKLKIQAVQEWPTPTKVKEVQSFLGFANFLRQFVANFSRIAWPLHNLVKKDTPWKWETKEEGAFQGLEDAITNAVTLSKIIPSDPPIFSAPIPPLPSQTFHPHALAPPTHTPVLPVAPAVVLWQPTPNHPLAAHHLLRKTCPEWNQSRPLALSLRLSKPSPSKLGPSRTKSNPKARTIIKGKGHPPTTIPALTAKFKEAFADPNAKRAAARKIATLTQTTTTSEYVTEFRNLIAELDWNKEAYIAQFTRSLHWKVKELLSTKDNIPKELEAIFAASIKVDNTRRKNEENRPKKAPAKSLATVATFTSTTTPRVCLSEDPNYVTPEERDHCCASGLCIKCGQKGHGIKQCPNGWKATAKEAAKIGEVELEKEKPLLFLNLILRDYPTEPIKTLIDSGATSNFISPSLVEKLKIPKTQLENPQVVRMLDGTISQTGCIWYQVQLMVLANGHPHTIPFLVCPIGNTPAILGMTWLTSESPLIDWQQGLVTFPEQVQIASEEEADPDSIADLPTQYREFARVFGKEEFKVLPPHWEYDIAINLVPDAKLSPSPLYGMTDAESKALKQHIEEELATGKI
ncbi:Retrotransposable element Tf2 protein [Rhizoctonia solani]|uniref:Retrotransposable element Tf2 protein n=1 Tax=Rhizoctonia solani TaxID=456999 RepID=A0A8H8P2S2_9AGAM|nr:Retrotransposable element Tf2 protein [Rhizoctonia solani]QRW22881.1 Retrotransposable element Tf2 protein [Rhizoctonia solani]